MMLFVVLTMLAVVHRRWGWAGATVALATLTWQPVFVTGAVVTLAATLALPRRELLGALLRFAVGGIIPTALTCAYFVAVGAFREFLDGFYLINADYTRQSGLLGFLGQRAAGDRRRLRLVLVDPARRAARLDGARRAPAARSRPRRTRRRWP